MTQASQALLLLSRSLVLTKLYCIRWAERQIRPISLRQLTFFGRTLTEPRLISSANYVRTELPTRYVPGLNGWEVFKLILIM